LIELLTVLAIVAILASIAAGGGQRAREIGKAARAKAELQGIAGALETYKRRHGDYPRTSSSSELLQALIGRRGPKGETFAGRALIDLAHFETVEATDPFADARAVLIDPWERPYGYCYLPSATWSPAGYILYSCGPDGADVAPLPNGLADHGAVENRDNLYANR
jgi:type II secretory pathway pseudopilin PulG